MADASITEKLCRNCNTVKPGSAFYKHRAMAGGLTASCKECTKEFTADRVERYKQARAEQGRPLQQKRCALCETVKPALAFDRALNRKSGLHARCKDCRRQEQAERKRIVVGHYSGGKNCCACCGEAHLEFLTIDHIDGGGHEHRKRAGSNTALALIKEGFPQGYRVLCFNCNCALGFFGYCPHQRGQNILTP